MTSARTQMATFLIPSTVPLVSSLVLILSSIILLLYYLKRNNSYWERRGAPYLKPTLLFGNTKDLVFQRVPPVFVFQKIYEELDGHKFGGFYYQTTPSFMPRDPELIRALLVKNFSYFHDRSTFLDEDVDPLASNLLNLSGQRWKDVRYKLTPTFTSNKLRLMHGLMKDCIQDLNKHLRDVTRDDSKTCGVQNLRDLMAKHTADIIGSCAFGLSCNSLRDESSEFTGIGSLIQKPCFRTRLRNILMFINPRLISFFKVKSMDPEVENFLRSVVREALKYRETSMQRRNDFVQLMIDLQARPRRLKLFFEFQNALVRKSCLLPSK